MNETHEDAFQWVASPLPCLRCLWHDRLITTIVEPEQLHPHCKCEVARIRPGEEAPHVFLDFASQLAKRPDLVPKHRRVQLRRGSISWDAVVQELAARAR